MRKIILLFAVVTTVTANAQTLKEALYGGKLKKDSNTVIRKTDDLSTKIDTTSKKTIEIEKNKLTAVSKDSSVNKVNSQPDPAVITNDDKPEVASDAKDNNKLWKEFMDSFINTLNTEVLISKKIKSGTYYILIDYEIGLEGQVTINNVYPAPENKFLQEQIKERLTLAVPQLNPVLLSTGKPRKVIKKYNFTLTKM